MLDARIGAPCRMPRLRKSQAGHGASVARTGSTPTETASSPWTGKCWIVSRARKERRMPSAFSVVLTDLHNHSPDKTFALNYERMREAGHISMSERRFLAARRLLEAASLPELAAPALRCTRHQTFRLSRPIDGLLPRIGAGGRGGEGFQLHLCCRFEAVTKRPRQLQHTLASTTTSALGHCSAWQRMETSRRRGVASNFSVLTLLLPKPCPNCPFVQTVTRQMDIWTVWTPFRQRR